MGKSAEFSLSLKMLGPFQLRIRGRLLSVDIWKSKKALLLLKYLAVRFDEKTPSDVLLERFWPGMNPNLARVNLHSTVYLLRQTLKEQAPDSAAHNWIYSAKNLYWLDSSQAVFIDIRDFTNYYQESERWEKSDPKTALNFCLKALKLYRGSFLPEDLYLDWICEIRDCCHNLYLKLVTRATRLLIDHQQDFKQAARVCRNALQHEPYCEELHRTLMQCLIGLGRVSEAFLQYKRCAKLLGDEFGQEPCPETKALLQEIAKPPADLKEPQGDGSWAALADLSIGTKTDSESALSSPKTSAEKTKPALTLLTIELDKSVVDSDIPKIFSALAQSLRKGDLATRWSDHLIAIVLQESGARGAYLVQQRIQTKLDPKIAAACRFSSRSYSAI